MKAHLLSLKSLATLGALAICSFHAQAALQITNVTVQAPTSATSGKLTVTGVCNLNGPTVHLGIQVFGSGGAWTPLGSWAGSKCTAGSKTVQVSYTQPAGNYSVGIKQGSATYLWPTTVVLP